MSMVLFSGLLASLPGSALAQQADTVFSVSTIRELGQAMETAQHIVLNDHLDLSEVPLQPNTAWMYPLQGVRSIRVRHRCYSAPVACLIAPRKCVTEVTHLIFLQGHAVFVL